MEYLSKQRYDEIAAELNNLIDVVYPEIRDALAETSAQGDRSENVVCLLSYVEFTNLATNTRMKFQIVSPHEMNLEAGKISQKSPIGAALMGKKVGDIAQTQTPSGTDREQCEFYKSYH